MVGAIRRWTALRAIPKAAGCRCSTGGVAKQHSNGQAGRAAVNEVFPAVLRVMGGRGMEDHVPDWRARG
jgi:hypothetical protein